MKFLELGEFSRESRALVIVPFEDGDCEILFGATVGRVVSVGALVEVSRLTVYSANWI